MTSGNWIKEESLYPKTAWDYGGLYEPKTRKQRYWNGADGRDKVNSYYGWHYEEYKGYIIGPRWIYAWNPPRCYPGIRNIAACTFVPAIPQTITHAAEPAALSNLISALMDSNLQLNVTLGEMPQTLTYIYDKLKPLIKAFKYLRKGDIKRALNAVGIHKINGKRIKVYHLRAPAEYWLEFRYAITPLFADINNGMERLQRDVDKPIKHRIRKGSRAVIPLIQFGETPMSGNSRYWPDRHAEEFCSAGCDLVAGFDYEAVDFKNPYSVAWELMPFSFVIDWVAGIGNWLRARWFFNYADYQNGFVTNLLKYKSGHPDIYAYLGDQISKCGSPVVDTFSFSFSNKVLMTRDILDTSYLPKLGLKHPITDLKDWKRAVDAVTLLGSVASGANLKYVRR